MGLQRPGAGNEIRIRKGETLRVAVRNRLPADDTSVHWHVPDAGTYWYHFHVGTQPDRGLYGPLIIEDPAEKAD